MGRYLVRAYADEEYGLKEQKVIIKAENYAKAKEKAWDMFAEYHEIGVWEYDT